MASDVGESFFVVVPKRKSKHDTAFLTADGSEYGEAPRCEVCGRPIGMRAWLPPFRVELTRHGTDWGDFAFFGRSEFLISNRAVVAIEDAGLSGLSGFEPVEAVKVKRGSSPPPYRHVVVARSRAAVDESRSSIVRDAEVTCEECRTNGVDAIHGFVLEAQSWTGEDVFIARGLPGLVIASEDFMRLAERHGFTNIDFVPTKQFSMDYRPFARGAARN